MSQQVGVLRLEDVKVEVKPGSRLASLPTIAGGAGIICLLAAVVIAGTTDLGLKQFFFAYLIAYAYFLSIALGGLFFVLVHFAARAGWSVTVRRVAENLMGTLPVFAVLFIPVLVGLHDTHHHWWHAEPGTDPILDHKRPFLNQAFFVIRAVVYLGLWSFLAWRLRGWSVAQDRSGDPQLTRKLQWWAPPGIAIFAVTLTLAAIDWLKSLDPHWFSTMWGVYYFAGCVLAVHAALVVLVNVFQKEGLLRGVVNAEHFHDLGKMLFAFVVFWTYIAFSQYFLIWYANIPEETLWYQHRTHGSWLWVSQFLMVGHFFVPFFFLLPRGIKRRRATLLMGALWMLVMHYADLYWVVMPVLHEDVMFSGLPVDLLALAGVGFLFLAAFAYLSRKQPVLAIRDPRLPESLAFENV